MGEWRAEQRFQGPGVERRFLGSATGSVVSCLGGLHSPCECVSRSVNADTFCNRSGKVVGCSLAVAPVDKRERERESLDCAAALVASCKNKFAWRLSGCPLAVQSEGSSS